jgi:hypothetical protein
MPTATIGKIRLTIVAELRTDSLLIVNNLGAFQPARNLRQGRPTNPCKCVSHFSDNFDCSDERF